MVNKFSENTQSTKLRKTVKPLKVESFAASRLPPPAQCGLGQLGWWSCTQERRKLGFRSEQVTEVVTLLPRMQICSLVKSRMK